MQDGRKDPFFQFFQVMQRSLKEGLLMRIITASHDFQKTHETISLTLGNFDGLHLGHQALLNTLEGQRVVLTFSNHPCEVMRAKTVLRLSTLPHKLNLLASFGIDTTLLLPFSTSLSLQSAEKFLCSLHRHIPFTHLVLGEDATLGHLKKGDRTAIAALSKELNFTAIYLPPIQREKKSISSSYVRKLIMEGDLKKASDRLGREFSVLSTVERGSGKGRLLGFQTANLRLDKLALPPLGVYVVKVIHNKASYHGVANLGFAPTMHDRESPVLEVHILDCQTSLYDEEIEVIFRRFLRPEKKHPSPEALKKQIAADILLAQKSSEYRIQS